MLIEKKKNLALVLSGGSARGLAHIGVLEVLEENHIPIDVIVGTSMGALVGGIYTAGTLKEFKEEIIKLSSSKINTIFLAHRLRKMNNDTEAIVPFLEKYTKDKRIQDSAIKFVAVATDLKTGEEVFIEKGSLLKAILASVCLPGIFHPMEVGKKLLVDGGVVDPLPQKYGHLLAEKVIAVNAMPKKYKYELKDEGIFEVLSGASGIMSTMLLNLKNSINTESFDKNKFVFLQLKTEKIDGFDFYNVERIINIGRKAAKKDLKKIIKLVQEEE